MFSCACDNDNAYIVSCTKQATFDPKNREDCIRYFEDCFSKLNADEVLPKLEAIDIVVSELAHFKDNHTSDTVFYVY